MKTDNKHLWTTRRLAAEVCLLRNTQVWPWYSRMLLRRFMHSYWKIDMIISAHIQWKSQALNAEHKKYNYVSK